MKKKAVVLENDVILSDKFQKYIESLDMDVEIIYMADQKDTDQIMKSFSEAEILLFEPTMIDPTQYVLMMMLMYDMQSKKTLSIREVKIYTYIDNAIKDELLHVWSGKRRRYLDAVLDQVKIYLVDNFRNEPVDFSL